MYVQNQNGGGKRIVIDRPTTAMANGMAFLTEDRKETGCFLILDVLENIQIAVLNKGYVSNGFVTASSASDASFQEFETAITGLLK